MANCGACRNFVSGGTVPPGKDGACIRQEKDIKGGLLTLSTPVSKTGGCGMFVKK